MENRRWLLARPDGAELEIIHDGFHVRAKPKGERWSNQSFQSPDEAGEAVDAWLSHLFETGWQLAAEGLEAELAVLWGRIAENPRIEGDDSDEDGEPARDESWLRLRLIAEALEPSMAELVAEKIVITGCETLQLSNRKPLIDFSALVAAITECPPPSVRRLIIDTLEQPLAKQTRFPWGEVGGLIAALPALEFAFIAGDVELAELRSSSLVSLRIAGDPILPGTLEEIAVADLPALRDLVLGLSVSEPADRDTLRGLETLLKSGKLPALERLQLTGVENPAALTSKLAGLPVFNRLRIVQISGAELEDEDSSVPLLLSAAAKLKGVATLGLGIDVLSEEAANQLTVAIPGLTDDFDLEDGFLPEGLDAWATESRLVSE